MSFTIDIMDRFVIFRLSDKIICSNDTIPVIDKLKEYIGYGEKNIVMDFSEVPWMNSQGVDMIVSAFTTSSIENCNIVFSGFSDQVAKVLIITRIFDIITSYPSLVHAVGRSANA